MLKRKFNHIKLSQLIQERGLGIEDVAKGVKRNISNISRWADGKTSPSPKSIRAIAKYFKVEIKELFV